MGIAAADSSVRHKRFFELYAVFREPAMRFAGYHGALHRPFVKLSTVVSTRSHIPLRFVRNAHQLMPEVELQELPNPTAKNIAILGAGLTGLTTAFQLARTIPHAKITVFEKEDRLGGWVNSEMVKVDGGEVLFEWGPRTIRPDYTGAGLATLTLLVHLGIYDKVIGISKTSPAATNRFIYYPDHLVKMPGPAPAASFLTNIWKTIYAFFTEPIFEGVARGIAREPAVKVRGLQVADESLGHFLRRRFGRRITDNLASAMIHGIYAGDIYNLSARTLMPALWYAETRDSDGNGVIAEFLDLAFKKQYLRNYADIYFQNLVVNAKDVPRGDRLIDAFIETIGRGASVYTFAQGTGFIAQTLIKVLEENPNVDIRTSTPIESIKYDKDTKQITLGSPAALDQATFDYVVSTSSPALLKSHLSNLQKQDAAGTDTAALVQQFDRASEAVNVMVVNLYYADPNLLSVEGFGYLIPQSVPAEENPERALGVLFSSETSGIRGPDALRKVDKPSDEAMERMEAGIAEITKGLADFDGDESRRSEAEAALQLMKKTYAQAVEDRRNPSDKTIRIGQDTAPGTKLTVMLGGHWWKDWAETDLPTAQEGINMAKSVLARHLKITAEPEVAKARLNRNCIPQYRPGYRQSMAAIHHEVLRDFQGRLKLAGTWWQGAVGVNDCVRKARLTAFSIRESWDDQTGLEDYCKKERYVVGDTRTNSVVMDPLQSSS